MAHDVVLIPGDGIGPEITEAMRRVVEATGVSITWHVEQAGAGVMDEYGTPLPQRVLDAVSAASTWLCAMRSTSTPACVRAFRFLETARATAMSTS